MIDHQTLGLTPGLSKRFAHWIAWYERDALDGKLDLTAFEEEGLDLARALKRELGAGVYVEFAPEPSGGKAMPSIPIDEGAA
jgi:hypothetical protein